MIHKAKLDETSFHNLTHTNNCNLPY